MELLDANTPDMDPSTDPNLDETAVADNAAARPIDAKSSDAGETDGADLLSVVRDVVTESRGEPQAASPAEGGEVSGDGAEKKELDDENYTDVPFHKHPRFQQVLRKSKVFEQDAVRYRNVQNFLDESGLSAAEAADGLTIMSMAKTDPSRAWEAIKPWVQNLLIASGEVLADDLRQRVQAGEMSPDAALELSRTRAASHNAIAAQSFRQQQDQRRQHTSVVSSLQMTAASWEEDRRLKDPNFDAKYQDVMKEVSWLIQTEGHPSSPEGVRKQLQTAYATVNSRVKPAQAPVQRKPAIRPITGGQVAGGQKPEAVSTLDIIRANRRTG